MQELANGYIALIGCGCQDNHFHSSKEEDSKDMHDAAIKDNVFTLIMKIYSYFWCDNRGSACIQEGQERREEVYRGTQQCRATYYGIQNHHITPNHCKVEKQKYNK